MENRENRAGKPVVGISIGDINGIGPEVILKALADPNLLKYCTPVVYGHHSVLNYYRQDEEGEGRKERETNEGTDADNRNRGRDNRPERKGTGWNVLRPGEAINDRKVNVVNCWQENVKVTPGNGTAESGYLAQEALKAMIADAKEGRLDAIVTAPIHKAGMNKETFPYAGHTEYLKEAFEVNEVLMMMISDRMRVALATSHIPLKDVSAALTEDMLTKKIALLHRSLIIDFAKKKGRIAVLGLNPHAGENGLLGTEEQDVISTVIDAVKEKGALVEGPHPADGFFGNGAFAKVDGILAMYHDQGLIPFKLMSFEEGVNYTAGLPLVRTSPDHGTGFSIAGKNIASENSMRAAIYAAIDITRSRQQHAEATENPLRSQIRREKENANETKRQEIRED